MSSNPLLKLITADSDLIEMLGCGLFVAVKFNDDDRDCLIVTLLDSDGTQEAETDVDNLSAVEHFLETVIIHAFRYSVWYTPDQIRSAFDIWDL